MLLVRAWRQDGELVARVRWWASGDQEHRVEVVVGPDEVELAVRRWLRAVQGPTA